MAPYNGTATMFMSMPMSTQALPINGTCDVDDKKVTLHFPFTTITFDLPDKPKEGSSDTVFKIVSKNCNLDVTVSYIKELDCFTGKGTDTKANDDVVTFTFYKSSNPMAKLPKL